MSKRDKLEAATFVGLVAAGAAARGLFSDLPNFAPVAAIALFAGYFFRSRVVALLVPLLVMASSDYFIGGYSLPMMALVYGALSLPVLFRSTLRSWLDRQSSPLRATAGLLICTLAGSLLFFALTNFGSWLWFDMYERSWAGLARCYMQAIPFFRHTLAGDIFFAIALFGGYALASQLVAAGEPEKSQAAVGD